MSFPYKCQPLTSYIYIQLYGIFFVCRIRAKNLSRRKKYLQINNFIFTKICCPVLCNRKCLQFMFISVSKFNNKGFLDCTYSGQAWSSKRLFAHILCRLSPRVHKLHICVSVMRVCLYVANLMTIAMLLCAHRQVRLCSVHMSPIFCVFYKEPIRLNILHSPIRILYSHIVPAK